MVKSITLAQGFKLWMAGILFYGYEFILRMSPSVMLPEWSQAFGVTQAELGHLSAFYYISYALWQIPAGVCLDYFGVRRAMPIAILFTSLGTLLLAMSPSMPLATLARIITGAGSAFGFIGCCKIAAESFDDKHFPTLVGFTNLAGVMGAIMGGAPLAHAVETYGWRTSLNTLALLGFLITLWILSLNKKDTHSPSLGYTSILHHLVSIVRSKQTWLIAYYGCFVMVPIAAFAELWAVPFLMQAYDYTRPFAAIITSAIFCGIAVGSPLLGYLSSGFDNEKRFIRVCCLGALFLLTIIVWVTTLSTPLLVGLMFLYGALTSHMLLCFTYVRRLHKLQDAGLVIGFTNMVIMATSALFQPFIGKLLDARLGPPKIDGLPSLLTMDYQIALSVLLATLVLAYCLTYFLKGRTHA